MEYTVTKGNIERVYSVEYDYDAMRTLLDEIVREGSYQSEGIFVRDIAGVNFDVASHTIYSGLELPNDDPIYRNIKSISAHTSNSIYGYYGDSIAIEGVEVRAPQLAYIIRNILNGENTKCIRDFFAYEDSIELIPIEERIADLDRAINETSNFDFDKKISQLEQLKDLQNQFDNHQYFNPDFLRQKYEQAKSMIGLKMIKETNHHTDGEKILFKDFQI